MTTSLWDNMEIGRQFSGCANLKELITRLETDFSARGEVICEIKVNGMPLSEADEAQFASNPIDSISDLVVLSNTPSDLIRGALMSAADLIPGLEKACLQTAEVLRSPETKRGLKLFGEALEGCQWLVETLMHVRGAASGTGEPVSQAERWLEAERVITRVVHDVSEAHRAGDLILVADLLEYELTGAIYAWQGAITAELERRTHKDLVPR